MTPQAIIEQVNADGVRLALSVGGKIKASGSQGAINRWLQIIQEHKPDIVAALQSVEDITIEPAAVFEGPHYPPGKRITWQIGAGGKVKEAVVDFVATYRSEMWAFCTFPNGRWTAVNAKYIRKK
jgi:hypothetical protein